MKKKILFFIALISALVCLLAISSSAATIYKDSSGNELFRYVDDNGDYDYESYSGEFPKFDNDNNALTWYITSTTTDAEGNTIHTVDSKITLGEAGSINANGAYSFTSPVTNKNTVSVNFPDNAGIKTWAFKSFGGHGSRNNNNILFVYCPNTLTAFENNPFQETNVIVVELDDETPITSIPQNFAHEARNLETINIPASVTIINGDSGKNGAPFYNGYSLTSVTFASMDNLLTMKKSVFANCTSLKTVKLPNSVTEIGERCFEGCSSLTSVNLGASLTGTTGWSVFRLCNSLNVYYIPSTFTTVYQHTFTHDSGAGPANTVFFYVGTKTEFEVFYNASISGKNNERVTSGYKAENVIEWDPTKEDSYYIDLATKNNCKYYVYNYNKCEAFYDGEHTNVDTDCATEDICGRECGYKIASHIPSSIVIAYTDYTQKGTKTVVCNHEGCLGNGTFEVDAIITTKGYSIKNDGCGIVAGYDINIKALEEYETAMDDIEIGIIMANSSFDENAGFMTKGEDGKYTLNSDYGIQLKITSRDYSRINSAIANFTTAESELKLVMALYVVDAKGVSYIQHKGQGTYADEVKSAGVTLDVVTIKNIATLTGTNLQLPEPKALPVENKEN